MNWKIKDQTSESGLTTGFLSQMIDRADNIRSKPSRCLLSDETTITLQTGAFPKQSSGANNMDFFFKKAVIVNLLSEV